MRMRQSRKRSDLWTIPNLLSVSRIAATPLLCHLMLNGEWKVAGVTFVVIALTDAVIDCIHPSLVCHAANL